MRTCLLRNAEETEDHGTVYETRTKKMREQIAAMKINAIPALRRSRLLASYGALMAWDRR